jgi:hypothetical protein
MCGGALFRQANRLVLELIRLALGAEGLMAPPNDPEKMKSMVKNPWALEMIERDVELLKLNKRKKDEQE